MAIHESRITRRILASALVLSVGAAGCSREANPQADPSASVTRSDDGICINRHGLEDIDLLRGHKGGGVEARNDGACIGIYDPKTLRDVGELATGQVFTVECYDDSKPVTFRVEAGGVGGNVNLGKDMIAQLSAGRFEVIPRCDIIEA